ncbi:DUF1661 domain-containing protein [Porphyromonas gingivalis]|uniref:DUF1661 domain-containing protein n=1 Tax=Porphyromonas gingivalis TaxID=837 RepID=UPI00102A8C93|nr:DUF1661 domain-containing protein [Porphyromonas gingivalis]
MWHVNFLLLAWEKKKSETKTKKISRLFFTKHRPQSEHFRLVSCLRRNEHMFSSMKNQNKYIF